MRQDSAHDIKTNSVWIGLTDRPLELSRLVEFLHSTEVGGIDLFIGTTRRLTGSKETVSLDYEAYEPMAVREIHSIVEGAMDEWPIHKAIAFHRLGRVPAGEASIVLGVSTAHRAEAFEACRFLIDTIKERVPIWKKELYTDGTTEWVQGQSPKV